MGKQVDNLLALERQQLIMKELKKHRIVRSNDLAELADVSIVTIRSDLKELAEAGRCKIIRGGATYNQIQLVEPELDIHIRQAVNTDAKRRIGKYAAGLIQSGQTVLIDAGTTTIEMIQYISPEIHDLRIVTPALNIALAANDLHNVEVYLTGGHIRQSTLSLVGDEAVASLSKFNAHLAFIASGGFTIEHGVTTSHLDDRIVKQTMISRATQNILLTDSSKLGNVLSLTIAQLSDFDMMITDSAIDPAYVSQLQDLGIEIILV